MTRVQSTLCTGVSGSIGYAIARALAVAYPASVVVGTYRTRNELVEELETTANVSTVVLDLMSDKYDQLPDQVDVLVNCAGIGSGKERVGSVPLDEFDTIINANLRVPFRLVQKYLSHMEENRFGRIININSIWGLRGSPRNAAYTISKHGLSGLTKSIAKDYGGTGITANEVCPGAVESRMMDRIVDRIAIREGVSASDVKSRLLAAENAQRFVDVDEIARMVVFLASEKSFGINGASLIIDGGNVC